MCGILGCVGKRPAAPLIIQVLRRLEYRCYDSAGVAVLGEDDGLQIRKLKGRIDNGFDKPRNPPKSVTVE